VREKKRMEMKFPSWVLANFEHRGGDMKGGIELSRGREGGRGGIGRGAWWTAKADQRGQGEKNKGNRNKPLRKDKNFLRAGREKGQGEEGRKRKKRTPGGEKGAEDMEWRKDSSSSVGGRKPKGRVRTSGEGHYPLEVRCEGQRWQSKTRLSSRRNEGGGELWASSPEGER